MFYAVDVGTYWIGWINPVHYLLLFIAFFLQLYTAAKLWKRAEECKESPTAQNKQKLCEEYGSHQWKQKIYWLARFVLSLEMTPFYFQCVCMVFCHGLWAIPIFNNL